jgi:hypothetical protein
MNILPDLHQGARPSDDDEDEILDDEEFDEDDEVEDDEDLDDKDVDDKDEEEEETWQVLAGLTCVG